MRFRLVALCILVGMTSACGKNDDARLAAAQQAQRTLLQADPDLADPLGQTVIEQVQQLAPGWVKHEPLHRGTLSERGRQGFLAVLPYGHCYRFFGAGAPTVSDLDLALYDANGVEVQRDITQDATPVLGSSASICPLEAGAFRIEARMRRGQGLFAIGLFRDAESAGI